jgi:Organic solvent tolerance protein.
MYDGTLTNSRWRLKADVDYTSDQDFLREFRNRPGMYNDTKETCPIFRARAQALVQQPGKRKPSYSANGTG